MKYWSKPVGVLVALLLAIVLTSQPLTPACGALAVATVLISRQLFSPLRVLARAYAAAVAFDGTALPRAVVTGAPVRNVIVDGAHPDAAARSAARDALGLPGHGLVVAVVGGSLGSRRLNEAALGLAEQWATRTDVALYHSVGRRDWSWVSAAAERLTSVGAPRSAVTR